MPVSFRGKSPLSTAFKSFSLAYESTLAEGLKIERRLFHGLFATKDQKEGKRAMSHNRPPF